MHEGLGVLGSDRKLHPCPKQKIILEALLTGRAQPPNIPHDRPRATSDETNRLVDMD
jgi:hypothetical protein